MQYPHPLQKGAGYCTFFVPSASETVETGTEKTDRRNVKNRAFTQKSVNVYVFFLPPTYPDSHIFYLILQQENQDLAYATHLDCPTGAFGLPKEQPSASNC